MLAPQDFFTLEGHPFAELFEGVDYVWQALDRLPQFLEQRLRPNVSAARRGGDLITRSVVLWEGEPLFEGVEVEVGDVLRGGLRVTRQGRTLEGASVIQAGAILSGDDIEIGRGVLIEAGALLKGPTLIGDRSEVRHGAYVRGQVLVGEGCVVGHATEIKASVMLGGSLAGHFAYLGDSILGRVNLGAGTKLANLRVYPGNVRVTIDGENRLDSGRRKLGAILGDGAELGCNCVTAPGTILGRGVVVYPNVLARGTHGPGAVLKGRGR